MESAFQTYRGQELAGIGYISTLKLKVIGTDGESKWLTITGNELEKIIAVLEPEDYAQAIGDASPVTTCPRHGGNVGEDVTCPCTPMSEL